MALPWSKLEAFWNYFEPRKRRPKRRPRKGGHLMPEPVEPDPRKPLSGAAEAPLEFDE
jgi:hypothetical protein